MTLILLVGPIASGRSTYAAKLAQEGALVVNDDAIVNAVHGGNYKLYSKNLKCLYKQIENSIIYYAIDKNLDVIIDRPNFKKPTRSRYINLAKSLDCKTFAVVFPWLGPDIHVQRRMISDSRGYSYEYWTKVYNHHLKCYELITTDEVDELSYKWD